MFWVWVWDVAVLRGPCLNGLACEVVDFESWCEGDVFEVILEPISICSSALLTYRPANFLLHEESGLMSMNGSRHNQSFDSVDFW
jgi:hypothetical protein